MPAMNAEVWRDLKTWVKRKAPELDKYSFQKTEEEMVGLGQRGTAVYRGTNKENGQNVAIKVISKKAMTREKKAGIRREALLMQEMTLTSHPSIVKFVEFFEDPKSFYIVMELMEGGEVFQQISQRGSFTESEARNVMCQVAKGVFFLHERGVVHRDLKPENLLCSKDGSLSGVKICDFGMAKKIGKNLANSPCGTVNYVAPEVIKVEGVVSSGYGYKADIWSLGVILYLLLSGRPPFYADSPDMVLRRIKNSTFEFPEMEWAYISDDAKDLIRKCLMRNPDERIDIYEFMSHPWLKPPRIQVAAQDEVQLASPLKLRQNSVPINEFLRLLTPRVLAGLSDSMEDSVPDSEPVRISEDDLQWGAGSNSSEESSADTFYRWTIGKGRLEFELPEHYTDIREAAFCGQGLFCEAFNTELDRAVAINKIAKHSTDRHFNMRLHHELVMLRQLRHENIVALVDGFVGPSEDYYVVTEAYDCTLRHLLIKRPLEEGEIRLILTHMLRALAYLHSLGLAHGSLKPHNLYLRLTDGRVSHALLGDFTLCKPTAPVYDPGFLEKGIAKNYWAPERLTNGHVEAASDIWSAGCILAEMLERKIQFPGQNTSEVFRAIIQFLGTPPMRLLRTQWHSSPSVCLEVHNSNYSDPVSFDKRFVSTSPEALDLLSCMINYDMSLRLTASGALAHPYLAQFFDPSREDASCAKIDPKPLCDSPGWRDRVILQLKALNEEAQKAAAAVAEAEAAAAAAAAEAAQAGEASAEASDSSSTSSSTSTVDLDSTTATPFELGSMRTAIACGGGL